MTVCELYSGAEIRGWGARRRAELDRHIEKCTVLPIDAGMALPYGQVIAASRLAGRELTPPDALIVATAKRFGLILLTHDRDMLVGEQLGVNVVCRV
jgi:predicted nucleic acid-binding protein